MVLGAVALIKGFQPFAGIVFALKTKPDKPFTQQIALVFHKETILAPRYAARAVCPVKSMLIQVDLHTQVTDA
jgi:hypothetical protein